VGLLSTGVLSSLRLRRFADFVEEGLHRGASLHAAALMRPALIEAFKIAGAVTLKPIERAAPEHRLAAATRRSMMLRFAQAAALRLQRR
jgi:DNA repair protein MmcB-like